METGNEQALAELVKALRRERNLSQEELAELARVSAKTVQRIEGTRPASGHSRRSVMAALDITPEQLATAHKISVQPRETPRTPWTVVDGQGLYALLVEAATIALEVDEEGRRAELEARPWYRKKLILATKDPVDLLLERIDQAPTWRQHGVAAARMQRELSELLRAARAMEWEVVANGTPGAPVHLYVGSAGAANTRLGTRTEPETQAAPA